MTLLLDFEGFKVKNTWFIKEIAFTSIGPELSKEGDRIISLNFELFPYYHQWGETCKKQIDWCTQNLHGLPWNDGDYPSSMLDKYLKLLSTLFVNFYAKGHEKCKVLSELLKKTVHNVEETHSCPPIKKIIKFGICCCHHHREMKNVKYKTHCSKRKVEAILKACFSETDCLGMDVPD